MTRRELLGSLFSTATLVVAAPAVAQVGVVIGGPRPGWNGGWHGGGWHGGWHGPGWRRPPRRCWWRNGRRVCNW